VGYLDDEGFLYVKDRSKDVIIRGGENIDSTTVENAVYDDPRVLDCAAVAVPDPKLGELVAVIVTAKDAYKGQLTEQDVIKRSRKLLPAFAVPVMAVITDVSIPRNATGKVVKAELRRMAKEEWEKRTRHLTLPAKL